MSHRGRNIGLDGLIGYSEELGHVDRSDVPGQRRPSRRQVVHKGQSVWMHHDLNELRCFAL
jgi:hypothetical protein